MFVPTKATVKLANRNTGHTQGIGIILGHFTNCTIIYPVGPVYYCPGDPPNTISLGALEFYADFQNVTYEPIEDSDFVYSQGCYWISLYQTQNNLDYLQIEISKVNPQIDRNIFGTTFYDL